MLINFNKEFEHVGNLDSFQLKDHLSLFKAFSRSSYIEESVCRMLDRLHANPYFRLENFGGAGQAQGAPLYSYKNFSISIGYRTTETSMQSTLESGTGQRVVTPAYDQHSTIIKTNGTCEWKKYVVPFYTDVSPLPSTSKLSQVGSDHVIEGTDFFIEAGREIVTFEQFSGDMVYISAVGRPKFHVTPIFNRSNLSLRGMNCGDIKTSRIQMFGKVLAHLGGSNALPALEELSRHSHHFVRWSSIRNAICIDPKFGLKLAQIAMNDIHPHVRLAANETLKCFDGTIWS